MQDWTWETGIKKGKGSMAESAQAFFHRFLTELHQHGVDIVLNGEGHIERLKNIENGKHLLPNTFPAVPYSWTTGHNA